MTSQPDRHRGPVSCDVFWRFACLTLLGLWIALCPGAAPGATITWTGAISSDWNNQTNWSPQQVPTTADTAVINSGNVTVAANSQFSALNLNGGYVSGPLTVPAGGVMNWAGGRLTPAASLTVQSNGLVTLSGSAQKDVACPMTNFGRVVLSGTASYVLNDGNVSYPGFITNAGSFEIQGDYTLGNYWGNSSTVFGNSGTVRKTAGTGTGGFGPVLLNGPAGLVSAESGVLQLAAGGRLDGTLSTLSGTVMDFHAGSFTYVPSNRLTGAGQYQLSGGTLQGLDDYLANLQLLGGTVFLSANYQTNGLIVRLDLNGATLGGSSNRVIGVLNVVNGGIGCALDVAANGVANLSGSVNVTAPLAVRANATMNWWAGQFGLGSSLLVETGGLVNMPGSGEKDLGGPMNNYGRVVFSGGAVYVKNDGAGYQGGVVNLGSWEMQGDLVLGQYWGNDLGWFVNGGRFWKTAGTGDGVIGLPFSNGAGTLNVWSGALRFDHGQQLDGLFVAEAGGTIKFNGGTFSCTPATWLTGGGVFQLTGGALTGLGDYLPNLQLLGGTVYLSPNYQTNGTIARLDLSGATLAGSNAVSGVLNFNSGYISGATTVLSNGVFNWNGGRFAQGSSLVVAGGGLLNLQTGGGKELGGPLANFGTVSWTGGGLSLINDGNTWLGSIQNFGLWDTAGDLALSRYFTDPYSLFRNNGLLRKSAGSGTATMDLAVLSQSAIEALGGTLAFSQGLSVTAGTMTFGLSNAASFGRVSVAGTATVNGKLAARLLDGYVPGVGTNFAVMTAGALSGGFTNTDGLNVGFGRVLAAVYSSTSLTLQAVATNSVNNPPTWAAVPNFTVVEGQTLLYTNQVSDPDGNQVLFKLVSAPTGVGLNLTNGVLSWTPSETQGGTSNYLTVRILDSGNPSQMATQSFSVVVLETNTAPVLPVIPAQLIGVGSTLTVTNAATDGDLPANTLTYALLSPPAGMNVDANGIITWTPTAAGSYPITVKVTDNGIPPLSATNSFTVGVLAQPTPPSGLVSWWTGNGTTADQNGVNPGALSGTASYAPGLFGQAFSFNGGYLTVLDSPTLEIQPGSALTVEMWVKRTASGPVPYYFGKRVNCGAYNYQSPADQFAAGSAYDSPAGQWRHLAWVFTGTEMLGYVNGGLTYRTLTALGPTNAAALFIGASGTCGSTFNGLIDEVRFYNRALSAAEVQSEYGAGSVGAPVIVQQPASQMVASGSNVVMTVAVTGLAPFGYQWWYNGAPLSGQTGATLSLPSAGTGQAGNYRVVVTNAVGGVTSSTVELTVLNVPVITLNPVGQPGTVGGTITLTTSATGSAPLAYQWRKGGVSISGATGTSLTLANLQVSDAGNYDVVAYNWGGAKTSAVAMVTVSAPIVWTGASSVYWTNSANWNPAQVPGPTDTAIINSGNVTLATNSQFYALSFNGGNISGPVSVGSNCTMVWTGGRLTGAGSLIVQSNGTVILSGSAEKDIAGPVTNFGLIALAGASTYVMNDNNGSYFGLVTNAGVFEVRGDYSLWNYWGNNWAVLGNGGMLRKTAGSGTTVIGPMVLNGAAGIVGVQTGAVQFTMGGRLDGAFTAGTGAVMDFHGGTFAYVPPNRFSGAGQYQFSGGVLNGLDDYLPNLALMGGTVNLSPLFQTNGLIVRLDLNGATLGGASNRVAGVLNVVNGGVSGALDVAAGGVANLSGGSLLMGGPVAVKANGTLNWGAGQFGQGSSLVVESGGLASLPGTGEKDLGGPLNNYGRVVLGGGSLYLKNDGGAWKGAVVNLGAWEMQGDCTLAQYWGNDLGSFANGGVFRKSAGPNTGVINLVFYTAYGAVEVWSGALRFDHGEQLDGLWTVDAGSMVQLNSGTFTYTPPGRFLGAGVYQLSGSSATLNGLSDYLANWQFTGGTVYLSPTYQTNGAIARLDLNGTTLGGSNAVSGVLNLNSGYVSGSVTVLSNGVMNWSGGRFLTGSSLLVSSNGLLNLLTAIEKDLGGPMTNYGCVVYNGNSLYLINDGGSWKGSILNLGVWDNQSDGLLGNYWGNAYPSFLNAGTLRKSAGTGTSTVDLVSTNQGGVEALSGVLAFNRGLSFPAGTMTFGLSSNTVFGKVAVAGTAAVNGSVGARLLNGFIPAVSNSFGVLSAGTLNGTFTNTDALTVGFGRVLAPSYTATALTLQALATNGVNNAPIWAPVPNFTIFEGQTLLFTNQVSDPDGNQVLFVLSTAPAGAALNLTNGVLSWTPTLAQGGTSNYFVGRIFDSGNPSLMVTQSWSVQVLNTNTAPVLPVVGLQLAGVGGTFTVTNTATDADIPANVLTYTLLNAPPGMTVDSNGVITWTPGAPTNCTVVMRVTDNGVPPLSATNSFTVGAVARSTPPSGLVSWWSGDGTTADLAGLNDGMLVGAAGYAPGLFGQAFSLNGGYVSVPDSASLDFAPGSAMTMEMWVKRTQPGGVPYYFGKRVSCGSYNYESPSDVVEGAAWNLPVGQWAHLAWVFTGAEMFGYVNGAQVYRAAMSLGPVNSVELFIGASGTCGSTFAGLVDDVRLYGRALLPAEVQALYTGQGAGVPVLTQQPASQTVASGTAVNLGVSANGAAPLSYQWWYNGAPVAGQTGTALNLGTVVVGQSGNYSVVVSNAVGSVSSEVAGLTVLDAPAITVPPQSQVGVVGGAVSFTVVASGTPTPALSYQWFKSGVPLSGQTTTALNLSGLQVTDSGTYSVVVGNLVGTATASASLTVATPIVWTGAASTDWFNKTNWNPQQVPTSSDTALINSGTVTLGTNSQFYALTVNGGFLSGSAVVASNSLMYWTGGRLLPGASLTVLSNGTVYLSGSASKDVAGLMTNWGRVVVSGTGLSVLNDNNASYRGGITNLGSWELQGDVGIANWMGNTYTLFWNGGTLRKTAGAGTSIVGPVVLNAAGGVVQADTGTLRFDGGMTMNGGFVSAAPATVEFHGGTFGYVPPSRFGGAGQYKLTGGTLNSLDDFVPNLQLVGGTVNLSPAYQTNGVIVRLDLNGATLGNASNRVVGVLNATGGAIAGVLEVSGTGVANLTGTMANGATYVRTNGVLNWAGGTFSGTGSLLVESNGWINLLGSADTQLAAPMTNFGHVVMKAGAFYVMNNAANYVGFVTNSGIWEMQGDLFLAQYWGNDNAAFINAGTFSKTAGTGVGVVNLPFTNSGVVTALGGTLRFDHGTRLDGNYFTGAGAAMWFNAGTFVYVPPSRFGGSGVYALTGGTLQGLDNYLPNLQLNGGTVFLSPTYQTNGPIVRLDLNGATLAGANQVIGVLNATNGGVGGLDIAASAVVNLNGTAATGATVVRSNATLNWLGGRFGAGSSLLVQSNGLVGLLTGADKAMGGVMTNFGLVTWSGGAFYIMNEGVSYFGSVTNRGIWELQADVGMGQWWGNDLGWFANQGTLRKTAGTGSASINVPFQNSGMVSVLSGTVRFDHSATLSGQFATTSGTALQLNNGTFQFTPTTVLTGGGAVNLTGGALQNLQDYMPSLHLLGGSVALSPTYQTNGPIVRLDLDGATLIGSNRVAGVLNLNSGYISGPLSVAGGGTLNWASGRFAQGSSLSVETNGIANLVTSAGKELGGLLTSAGSVEWTGGAVSLINDAATWAGSIVNSGLWEMQGDLTMSQYWVNNYASFQNNGLLRKAAGSGTGTMDVVFINQGTIEQLSGIWTFGRNFSLTGGTVTFGLSSDTAYGRINLGGTASLAGRLAARLLNGYLPAVGRTFQVMNYGVVAGSFTDYSGLDTGLGRAFVPLYTPTSLTLQAYSTNAVTPIVISNPVKEATLFRFTFTADVGTNYTVLTSSNLVNWSTLLVTNLTVSPAAVTDAAPASAGSFYRIKQGL